MAQILHENNSSRMGPTGEMTDLRNYVRLLLLLIKIGQRGYEPVDDSTTTHFFDDNHRDDLRWKWLCLSLSSLIRQQQHPEVNYETIHNSNSIMETTEQEIEFL
jgi:hypothetical protein